MANISAIIDWEIVLIRNVALAETSASGGTSLVFDGDITDETGTSITKAMMLGAFVEGQGEMLWFIDAGDFTSDSTATVTTRQPLGGGLDITTADTANDFTVPAGTPIYCVIPTIHAQQSLSWQTGSLPSGANALRVGDLTNSDIKYYFQNADTNKPFIMYDASEDEIVGSKNGVDTFILGTGAGSITGGDGIAVTAGDIDVDLATNPGLEISTAKLRAKVKSGGGVARDGDGLSVDTSDNFNFTGDLQKNGVDVADVSNFKFGGDGSDGALDTSGGSVEINLSGANEFTKNYSSINIASNNLTFINPASDGTNINLRCSGDCLISAAIVGNGLGADGGAGGDGATSSGAGLVGVTGTEPFEPIDQDDSYAGVGGLAPANSSTGAAAQTTVGDRHNGATRILYANPKRRILYVVSGAGGGGGSGGSDRGGGDGGNGGAGGKGGGAITIEVKGSLNFTGSVSCNAVAGTSGTAGTVGGGSQGGGGGGGGSGGGGGMVAIMYNSQTAISGTMNVLGAAGASGGNGASGTGDAASGGGGASGSGDNAADGGNGGSGGGNTQSTAGSGGSAGGGNGGNASGSSGSTGGGGGGGGGGANGKSVIFENTVFS